jgi:hypothetical protein
MTRALAGADFGRNGLGVHWTEPRPGGVTEEV